MAYIIDTYNKFNTWDRTHACYKFRINGNWYAIKEVEMDWGLPQLGFQIEDEVQPDFYHVYDTYEDALAFAEQMKTIN